MEINTGKENRNLIIFAAIMFGIAAFLAIAVKSSFDLTQIPQELQPGILLVLTLGAMVITLVVTEIGKISPFNLEHIST